VHSCFDRTEDARYLVTSSTEIGGGEDPQGDRRNAEFGAPIEDLVEFLSPNLVDLTRVVEPLIEPLSPVAIQDDANMTRHRLRANLLEKPALIEMVEKTQHSREPARTIESKMLIRPL
jgi:hypothetical protein